MFFRRPGEPRWPLVGIWLWLRRDLWRNYVKTTLVLVGLWNPYTLLGSNSRLLIDHTILGLVNLVGGLVKGFGKLLLRGQPTPTLLSQLSNPSLTRLWILEPKTHAIASLKVLDHNP